MPQWGLRVGNSNFSKPFPTSLIALASTLIHVRFLCFLTALKSSLTHAVDVRWVRETGSTNDDLKLWAHKRGFDKPVLLTADYQTAGRGTRGRVWRNVRQSLIFR